MKLNRRQVMALSGAALAGAGASGQNRPQAAASPDAARDLPNTLLLKDYHPKSIYRIPQTRITKARHPIVDVHCHGARPITALDEWVRIMDAAGVEKAVIFTGASSGEKFAEAGRPYAKYPGRFDLWCSFDFAGADEPGFGPGAVKALEECHRAGALGVGEVSDKGWGFRPFSSRPRGGAGAAGAVSSGIRGSARQAPPPTPGPHADDPRMDALWDKCAQLGMPVNIHVSDPIWSYQPMDNTNDGLMNGWTWQIDDKKPGILGHDGLIESLDRAVGKHPRTVFIACHLANLDYDLERLGRMFERHPNLYADISARFAETAPIPRFMAQFFQRYPDRVLYGTDMAYNQRMFSATFRILESLDEHFYEQDLNFNFNYHWPLNGFGLPDGTLRKVYGDNARNVFRRARGGTA